MAKEFKRSGSKDFKGKKSFGPKKEKSDSYDKKPFFDKNKDDLNARMTIIPKRSQLTHQRAEQISEKENQLLSVTAMILVHLILVVLKKG